MLKPMLVAFRCEFVKAGVWPQEKRNGYMALSFTYFPYLEVINGSLFDTKGSISLTFTGPSMIIP